MKSVAVAIAAVAVGAVMVSNGASAKEYTIEVTPDHRKCYQVNYIPATYRVNTKGKLVEGVRKRWRGDFVDGAVVTKEKMPAVYIETRRLVEADHYSLRRVSCR